MCNYEKIFLVNLIDFYSATDIIGFRRRIANNQNQLHIEFTSGFISVLPISEFDFNELELNYLYDINELRGKIYDI